MNADTQQELLGPLLRGVSRSFYLTLRVLPSQIRPQVSVAYLLARASDTIADTGAVPASDRIGILRQMQEDDLAGLPRLAEGQASPAEAQLLRRLPECLALRDSFAPEDRARIGELHHTIIDGQVFDLDRFPGETGADLVALSDDAELERYTYLVAGCVGEFWTRMCVAHLPELAEMEEWTDGRMEARGVRFGKGLQLVNILRDMPGDLRRGRCYLPVDNPGRLLEPSAFGLVSKEYHDWLDRAVTHLAAGWEYTMHVPASQAKVRLACTWPIWIGLMTIARLRRANPLDPLQRIKVTRGEVYGVMARSWLARKNDRALGRRYEELLRNAHAEG